MNKTGVKNNKGIDFSSFEVPDISKNDEKEMLNVLQNHLATSIPNSKLMDNQKSIYALIKLVYREASEIALVFCIYCIITLVACIMVKVYANDRMNVPMLLMTMAPLPFLTVLHDVFRGRNARMLEIELSCKISIQKLLISRILAALILNIGLCLVSCILIGSSNTEIVGLLNYYLIPLFWIGTITMIAIDKVRSDNVVVVMVCMWLVLCLMLLANNRFQLFIKNLNAVHMLLSLCLGIVLFVIELIQVSTRSNQSKRIAGSEFS